MPRLTGLLLALALVCGCEQAASVIPTTGPLMTVETRGGMCIDGPCGQTVVLERDGRVHAAAKPPNELGTVEPQALAALAAAIDDADFEAIRSKPFTGECPVAFDGQELVFTFATAVGNQRLASCEVEIDYGSPLFVAVGVALGPFVPLPLS